MSTEAVAWASDQLPPRGRAKELLRLLASFADARGEAWAAIGTLGEEMQLADRRVQYLLRALEAGGFIVRTGRFHHRNVPFYQLALDRPGELAAIRAARRAARRTPKPELANGAKECTVDGANGAVDCTPNGALQCTRYSRDKNSSSDELETRARDPHFLALSAAWTDHSPSRVNPQLCDREWPIAAAKVDPARLAAAGLRYLAEAPDAKRLGATSLHRWLAERMFEPWLADPVRRDAVAPGGWPGPPEIRAFVVDQSGEAFAGSYLDRADWDGERRAILTRTSIGAQRLVEALSRAGHLGVKIIEKGRAP